MDPDFVNSRRMQEVHILQPEVFGENNRNVALTSFGMNCNSILA